MKKIISAILSIAIIIAMMTVSFAAVSFDTTTATTAALSFGGYTKLNVPTADAESFTVNVLINTDTLGFDVDAMELWFTAEGVSIENISAQTAIGALGSDVGEGVVYTSAGNYASASDFAGVDNVLATLTLKKATDGNTATLSFTEGSTYINGTDYLDAGFASLTINFEEEQQQVTYPTLSNDTFTEGEEVFEGYTATAAATGITVFQKTAEDLAAESYGIQVVTGGKTYKFPGKVAITLGEATEKIWGIKIVAPAGTFQDGAAFAPTSIKAYVGTTLSDELVSAN